MELVKFGFVYRKVELVKGFWWLGLITMTLQLLNRVELLKFGFVSRRVAFFKGFCWLGWINMKVQLVRGGEG